MKIVCESCGAKYSIADEKVAGKVFKIRCKKCSAVIVVKGDQPATSSADAAPAAEEGGGDGAWHVVVSGEQQGPFAPRQIGELLAEGKIDWEAYVWREGMEGWQPAKDVPSLVSAVMAESESGDAAKATSSAKEPDRFGTSGDMGADPFAGGDDGGLSGVIGQQPAVSVSPVGGGADLFADSARGAFAAAAAADEDERGGGGGRVSGGQAMTGQRNENSVLFSLSNLQALATGSGGGATPSTPKAGMAQGEGSGLIDIRALASATQAVPERQQAPGARAKVEDLLAVGSTGTSFSATSLAAPVAVEKRDQSRTMLYAMGGLVLLLAGAVTFLVLRSPASQPTAQLTPAQEPGAQQAPQPGATTPAAPSTAPQAAEPSPTTTPAPRDPQHEEVREPERPTSDEERGDRREHRRRGDRSDTKAEPTAAAPTPAPTPEKKPDRTGSSLDDLLDTALGGKSKPASKPAASNENLPATPSREDVLSAMKAVQPKVQACGGGQSGVATAKVTVAGPTAKVTGVEVTGQFAGTPVASCIAKEVAKAKFNRFTQVTFSFSFPFKI